jgi:uncharacterized protein (TIGR02145 family)
MAGPGQWVFNPADNSVIAGSASSGNPYQVTYRYTNSQGCFDEKSITVSVYASNAASLCPGTLTDCRDGKTYTTMMAGGRCWMAENLDFGTFINSTSPMTDNCSVEKYCQANTEAQCSVSGGYYQWGEIVDYLENSTWQDICPPGWHVPTTVEWDGLINTFTGDAFAGSYLKDLVLPDGFHALLPGVRYQNYLWAYSSGSLTGTMFWTSTPAGGDRAVAHGLNTFNTSVSNYQSGRANAFSLRCVRN